MVEVVELLNREGVPHLGCWTLDSVKDIVRRGRMYLGFSRIVVERVVVRDRRVETIAWTPPTRPHAGPGGGRECPQGALGTRPLSADDSLAWYVA